MTVLQVFRVLGQISIAAGLALATLITRHVHPQTVFFAEWWSAAAAIAGLLLYVVGGDDPFHRVRTSSVPFLVGVMLLVCLAWQWEMPGSGYVLYAGFFLLSYVTGGLSVAGCGVSILCSGMVICALLQSLAGLVQLLGVTLDGWVMQKMFLQAFGNIGQANHYADLIFIGLGAHVFLCAKHVRDKRILLWPALALAFWLTLAAAASASRSTLLYTFAFFVLGGLAFWRGKEDAQVRYAGKTLLLVGVFSVISQLLVTYGHILSAFDVTTALDRADDAGSNGQRLYNWGAALQTIKAHPLMGQGPATFYKASIDAMFTTPPASFPKFAENAHNLILNMAAELGLPLTILVLGGIGVWYVRKLFISRLSLNGLLALSCIATVGLHSMVEYPLWYSYFILPVGLCFGIADQDDHAGGKAWILPAWGPTVFVVLGGFCLVWTMHDWFAVRAAYSTLAAGEPETTMAQRAAARDELATISRYSVFASQAQGLRIQSWHPDEGFPDRIAQQCDAFWQYKPAWYMMMRCAEAYAETDQSQSLERISVALCEGFLGYQQELKNWAQAYDGKHLGGLTIMGRACLRQ